MALRDEFVEMASARMLDESGRQAYYDLVRRFDEAVDQSIRNQYLLGATQNSVSSVSASKTPDYVFQGRLSQLAYSGITKGRRTSMARYLEVSALWV